MYGKMFLLAYWVSSTSLLFLLAQIAEVSSTGVACKDELYECDLWKHFYRCEYDTETRSKCPKTCGLCSENPMQELGIPSGTDVKTADKSWNTKTEKCADYDYSCSPWKEMGHCESKKEFMERTCPYSCGVCQSEPDLEISEGTPTSCANYTQGCFKYLEMGLCGKHPEFMGRRCRDICQACLNDWLLYKKRRQPLPCRDTYEHCDQIFFSHGEEEFCKNHESYAMKRCAKTCDFCDGKNPHGEINARRSGGGNIQLRYCRDLKSGCKKYAVLGLCNSENEDFRQLLAYYCRKTCEKCHLIG